MTCDGDDVIDDKKHHTDDDRKTESALADDGSQWCADEEEQQTGYAEREFLMQHLLMLPDVSLLSLEVLYVNLYIVDLISYGGLCHVDDRFLFFIAEVVQERPLEHGDGVEFGFLVFDVFATMSWLMFNID